MKKLLFFGDSITDMCRQRTSNGLPYELGFGHVFIITAELKTKFPNQYQIVNSGISGNRSVDLFDRYEEDVIKEKPDVLTILIGVNDVWHALIGNGVSLKKYKEVCSSMIKDIKAKLPNITIIVLEPFMLKGEATIDNYEHFEKVFKYARAIRKNAKDNDCYFVPLQKPMEKEIARGVDSKDILYDGVHPNIVGINLIAREWLKTFKKISK